MNGRIFPPIPTPSSTDDDLLPSDIICAGSDDECDDNAEAKRERDRRITEIAENYLHGNGIYMLSAGLRGPVEGNPWKTRKRKRLGIAAGNSGGGWANRQKDGRIVDFFSAGKIACGRASSKRNFVTTAATATATRSSGEDHQSPIPRTTAQHEPSPARRRLSSPADIRVVSSPLPQAQTQTQPKRKRELEAGDENRGEVRAGGENDIPMVIDWKKKRPKIDFSVLSPMVLKKCQKENTKGKEKEKEKPEKRLKEKAKDNEKDGVYVRKHERSVSVSEREVQTEVEKITRKTGARQNESPTETIHITRNLKEASPSGSAGERKDTEEGESGRENGATGLQGKSTRAVQTEKEATGAKPAELPTEGVLLVSTGGGGNTNNGGEMRDAVLQPTGEPISPPVEDTIRSSPASREPSPPEQVAISSPPKPVEPLTLPKPAQTPIHPVVAAPHQDPNVIREAEQIRSQVISTYLQNMAAQPETPYAWQSTQAQFLAAQDGFFNALADSPIRFPYITPENRRKSQLSDDDTPDLSWGILPYAMIPHPPPQSVPSIVGKLRSSTAPPPTASRFIPPPPKTPGSIVRAAPVAHPLPPPPVTPLNNGSSLAVPSTSELTPFGAFASPTPSKPRSDHAHQPAWPLLSLRYENTPSKPSSPPPLPSPDNTVSEMMDIIGRDVWDIDEELKKLARKSTPSTTNASATGRKEMRAGRNLV